MSLEDLPDRFSGRPNNVKTKQSSLNAFRIKFRFIVQTEGQIRVAPIQDATRRTMRSLLQALRFRILTHRKTLPPHSCTAGRLMPQYRQNQNACPCLRHRAEPTPICIKVLRDRHSWSWNTPKFIERMCVTLTDQRQLNVLLDMSNNISPSSCHS